MAAPRKTEDADTHGTCAHAEQGGVIHTYDILTYQNTYDILTYQNTYDILSYYHTHIHMIY
ncbi:hypothetical protein B484DRAFT_459508 [Ochromonadaceae sp. CCMP2298]|nr:hypothetical protein B484DRAFT_459508 [Ochromonadaceae sp. CCMP2298]